MKNYDESDNPSNGWRCPELNEELLTERKKYIKELEAEGQLDPECLSCKSNYQTIMATGMTEFGPRHKASDSCESGKHKHCTCDTCF